MDAKPQVSRDHYFKKKYRSVERFVSYFTQIDLLIEALSTGDRKALEVGVGDGVVSEYLRRAGVALTTCDFDASLKPDVVGDVRALPFPDAAFDAVCAFEVLEHIPFEDFGKALSELGRVSRGSVIVSFPYRSTGFEWVLKFPGIRTLFKRSFFDFFIRVPLAFRRTKPTEQHYWEIDARAFSRRRIRALLEKRFAIVREVRPPLDAYHLFFVLTKR